MEANSFRYKSKSFINFLLKISYYYDGIFSQKTKKGVASLNLIYRNISICPLLCSADTQSIFISKYYLTSSHFKIINLNHKKRRSPSFLIIIFNLSIYPLGLSFSFYCIQHCKNLLIFLQLQDP